jgi:ubiquinone/menaquinone biosynthesis C-methylase UbiE
MSIHIYHYPGADDPAAYEQLNLASDPDRRLEQLMFTLAPLKGARLLDIGAGSGFHAVRYVSQAAHVFALEPDPRMLVQLHAHLAEGFCGNISVLAADAEHIPLLDASIDIAIARFAYFFGTPACLPGLAETRRVLAPRGSLFVIDTDPARGQVGALARQVYPSLFHPGYRREHETFSRAQGFTAYEVDTVLRLPSRAALCQVLRLDYPHLYDKLLAQTTGLELTYSLIVYHLRNTMTVTYIDVLNSGACPCSHYAVRVPLSCHPGVFTTPEFVECNLLGEYATPSKQQSDRVVTNQRIGQSVFLSAW